MYLLYFDSYLFVVFLICCMGRNKYFWIWNVFLITDINHSQRKPIVEHLYVRNLNMINMIQWQLFRQPIHVWNIQVCPYRDVFPSMLKYTENICTFVLQGSLKCDNVQLTDSISIAEPFFIYQSIPFFLDYVCFLTFRKLTIFVCLNCYSVPYDIK